MGNQRAALDRESLGVPVLAIGVPTMVEGATLAADLSKILGYAISMALQPGLGLEKLERLLS